MKPLPFPFELVIECPALASKDALALGATVSALYAYWRSGCQPFPEDDAGLSVAARCHTSRWHRVRERVKPAIKELLPELAAVYAERLKIAQGKHTIARKGGLARAAKGKPKAMPPAGVTSSLLADPRNTMLPIQPIRLSASQKPAPALLASRAKPCAMLTD